MCTFCCLCVTDMLKFCFMIYDKDRSGLMEMEELHHFIKVSLLHLCPSEKICRIALVVLFNLSVCVIKTDMNYYTVGILRHPSTQPTIRSADW